MWRLQPKTTAGPNIQTGLCRNADLSRTPCSMPIPELQTVKPIMRRNGWGEMSFLMLKWFGMHLHKATPEQ